jgi:hypothetical protein
LAITAVGPNPSRVVTGGDGPGVLVNRDINNQALIGKDISITGQNINSYSILDPLVGIPVSGDKDIYGCCLPGVQSLNLDWITGIDAQNWQPSPGQAAEQISALGIPPVDNPTALLVVFNQTIAAGATYTSPRITVKTFNSIFGKLFCTATASGIGNAALAYPNVEFDWSVASDNYDPLRTENWFIAEAPFNFTYNYINQWASPMYGDTLTLSVTNNDTQPVNLTFGLFGSYRTRIRSTMRGLYSTVPTPTQGLGSDNVVIFLNWANIAVANYFPGGITPAPALANLWEGPVTVAMTCTGTAAKGLILAVEPFPGGGFSTQPQWQIEADATGTIPPTQIILPRRACGVFVINNLGAIANPGQITITGQVQPE